MLDSSQKPTPKGIDGCRLRVKADQDEIIAENSAKGHQSTSLRQPTRFKATQRNPNLTVKSEVTAHPNLNSRFLIRS